MYNLKYQMEKIDPKSKLIGLGIKIAVVPEIMSRDSCLSLHYRSGRFSFTHIWGKDEDSPIFA